MDDIFDILMTRHYEIHGYLDCSGVNRGDKTELHS